MPYAAPTLLGSMANKGIFLRVLSLKQILFKDEHNAVPRLLTNEILTRLRLTYDSWLKKRIGYTFNQERRQKQTIKL